LSTINVPTTIEYGKCVKKGDKYAKYSTAQAYGAAIAASVLAVAASLY